MKDFRKYSKEDKKKYMLEKKERIKNLLKESLCSKEELSKLHKHFTFDSYDKFYNYSLLNTFLIFIQGGEVCLSFSKWKKLNRYIKKGSRAKFVFVPLNSMIYKCKSCGLEFSSKKDLKIHFKNFESHKDFSIEDKKVHYKLGNVFDIKDTEGEELNINYIDNTTDKNNISFSNVKEIIKNEFDINIIFNTSESRGYVIKGEDKIINLSKMQNDTDLFKTCMHELAHLKLHTNDNNYKEFSKEQKETESEAVSLLVAGYFGLDINLSEVYIKNWSNTETIKDFRFSKVFKLAENFINLFNNKILSERV